VTGEEQDQYRLELYKSLRSEAAGYVEKVPGIWLQKFALIGGILAFLIEKHADISSVGGGDTIFQAAVVAVPILAALLDAKILEYTLHARAISRFIAEKYTQPSVIREWEETLWVARLWSRSGLRSLVTILVTIVPTVGLVVLAGVVLDAMTQRWPQHFTWAVIISVIYLVLCLGATFFIWRDR